MAVVTVNGVRLHYELLGVGDAVVFVHGSLLDHHDWDGVAAQIAQSFQVLSYDRRGHSQSSGTGTFDDDVADLAALIEHLRLAPVHLVGNSLGGCIALRLALGRPELLRSVSVHEPPLLALLAADPETRPIVEQVQRRVQAVLDEFYAGQTELGARRFVDDVALGQGAWERLPRRVRATIIGNAATFIEENTDPGIYGIDLQALPFVDIPVLLTHGTQSPPFFASILDGVQAALPQVERRVLRGTGQVPQLTDPDLYAAELHDFSTAVKRITEERPRATSARGSTA
ncbi:MAG TPA: alpha/beta hydrolase [Propionibacteriaceae bacterium]